MQTTHFGLSWDLQALEQENQRLEEEIFRIQLARGRKLNYEGLRVCSFIVLWALQKLWRPCVLDLGAKMDSSNISALE